MGKIPLRVEPERPLDEGTEWVVGSLTETVESSLLTEAMESWAATPWTESVDFYLELHKMSSLYGIYLAAHSTWPRRSRNHGPSPPPHSNATGK